MSSTDCLPLAATKRATAWSAFLRKLLTVSLTIRAGIRHQGSKKTKANARREAPVRRASTQQAIAMKKKKKAKSRPPSEMRHAHVWFCTPVLRILPAASEERPCCRGQRDGVAVVGVLVDYLDAAGPIFGGDEGPPRQEPRPHVPARSPHDQTPSASQRNKANGPSREAQGGPILGSPPGMASPGAKTTVGESAGAACRWSSLPVAQ